MTFDLANNLWFNDLCFLTCYDGSDERIVGASSAPTTLFIESHKVDAEFGWFLAISMRDTFDRELLQRDAVRTGGL